MGDPKRIRKKYDTPQHPWEAVRMEEESVIFREYGLKNKKEIWRLASLLRKYNGNAKKLIASRTAQSEVEKIQLLTKLQRLGLLQEGARLEDVLSLSTKDFMERRLQSVVFKKGLARSMKQARQFIIHHHIIVNGKKISVPSYLVLKEEEPTINFTDSSTLTNPDHPERKLPEKPEVKTSLTEGKSESVKDKKADKPAKKPKKVKAEEIAVETPDADMESMEDSEAEILDDVE